MNKALVARRKLIQLLSAVPAAVLIGITRPGHAAAAPTLTPLTSDDPTAKALGYTNDSSKVDAAAHPGHTADQKCSTCVQYQGKPGEARGGCNIYPGKSVSPNGWCTVWAKKT